MNIFEKVSYHQHECRAFSYSFDKLNGIAKIRYGTFHAQKISLKTMKERNVSIIALFMMQNRTRS
jgi:hypothetical protein